MVVILSLIHISRADYDADRWQSTRPYDRFWGRRKLASLGYQFQPDSQHKFNIQGSVSYTHLADTGVIRAAQRNIHQCKNGINKTLCSPQGQPEHAFNDQHGGDGEIRIALRSSP